MSLEISDPSYCSVPERLQINKILWLYEKKAYVLGKAIKLFKMVHESKMKKLRDLYFRVILSDSWTINFFWRQAL